MLAVIACLAGVGLLLLIGELARKAKILKGEYLRKFVHITVGIFVAFWPWIISWSEIQLIGAAMFLVVLANRRLKMLHFSGNVRRESYGDFFLALAIIACAFLTHNKFFFMIAILNASIADGVAAIVGLNFGKQWRYKLLGQTKTILGSMSFWLASLCVLGVSVLFAHNNIDFTNYIVILLALPPILTAVENVAILGSDDLVVPLVVLLALHLAQIH